MAVVVQRMVVARAAGILFTADPVTSNRRVASVEAVFGLGEALVSGRANADVYRCATARSSPERSPPSGAPSRPRRGGGTQEREVEPRRQAQPALTDAQVVRLVRLGRRIEAHFGHPQDIEWCLAGDRLQFVQSRPSPRCSPSPSRTTATTTSTSRSATSR